MHFSLLLQSGKWTLGEARPEPGSGQKHRFFDLRFCSQIRLTARSAQNLLLGQARGPREIPPSCSTMPPTPHRPRSRIALPSGRMRGPRGGVASRSGSGSEVSRSNFSAFPSRRPWAVGSDRASGGFSGGDGPGPSSSGLPGPRHPPTHRRRAAGSRQDRA